jgi:putative phage-type endonuclease
MELIIKEITTQENGEELISIIKEVYSYARKAYFAQFMTPRSYPTTFIRRAPNHEIMKVQIEFLRNKPQPEQRTDEWYKFRYNLLTASSIWKTFSSPNSQNQLIYEKCTPLNVDKYHSVNTESAMHHGQKYEDLSLMYYEKIYNTKVEDFGCIKHDDYYYIGASPDGINVDPSSSRYGRMLEIKNIVNREITGIPKEEYWIQMQVQMETCNMNDGEDLSSVRYLDGDNCLDTNGAIVGSKISASGAEGVESTKIILEKPAWIFLNVVLFIKLVTSLCSSCSIPSVIKIISPSI